MVETKSEVLVINHIKNIHINKTNVESQVKRLIAQHPVTGDNLIPWLLTAITHIDLTTLSGDDTKSNVFDLCKKAGHPLEKSLLDKYKEKLQGKKIHTAAVCVYPNKVKDAHDAISKMGMLQEIQIASVATGFPSGQYGLETKLQEIEQAVSSGATEIDVVLDRSQILSGEWDTLYNEVVAMKKACGEAHLKVILGTGQLGSYDNVYRASMLSMYAGADFIKTSTGMETVNATLPNGLIMCRAIRRYYQKTGKRVGLKPAGGIKTATDAVNWMVLVYTELGPEWLTPKLFRIGASSLLQEIIKAL